jgi:hypothetical protein
MRKLLSKLLMLCTIGAGLITFSCGTTTQILKEGASSYEKGVWHKIEEGQTLWRIAKTYRVGLEELKEVNDIQDVVHVSRGSWIFIPGAAKLLYVQGNSQGSHPQDIARLSFNGPVKGEIIRPFGKFENDFNFGIDVRIRGDENVLATQKGTVVLTNVLRGYGTTIIIEHDDDFCSLYSRDIKSVVKEGQSVDQNTVIARVDTGKNLESTVVHYELFYRGKPVNPLYYLP